MLFMQISIKLLCFIALFAGQKDGRIQSGNRILEDTAWEGLQQGGPTIWLRLQGTVDASGTLSYIVEILLAV